MQKTNEDKQRIFFNQNIPNITYEGKKIDSTGNSIEQEYYSVSGNSLEECKKIIKQLRKELGREQK